MKIIYRYNWKKAIYFAIFLNCIFFLALYQTYKYIENRDREIYSTGYEIGRYNQLNESAQEAENMCFQLSKNGELNMLLKKYFRDCKTARIMYAIAQAESAGKQFAVGQNDNGSMDGGWLQVNTIHRKKWETKNEFITRMHILEENIKEAKAVLDKQGLTAWVTYNTGKYKQYLK